MGELVLKNAVKREKGYMYYLDKEGSVFRSKLGRKKKGAKTEEKNEVEESEPKAETSGYMQVEENKTSEEKINDRNATIEGGEEVANRWFVCLTCGYKQAKKKGQIAKMFKCPRCIDRELVER